MKKADFPLVMKSTAVLTGVLTVLLAVLYRLFPLHWILPAVISAGTACYHFSMRLLVGTIVPRLIKNKELVQHIWFQPRIWEESFYRRLRIKHWKKHVPTYAPGSFSLETNTLAQVVRNMCVSELVHETIVVFSFLPLLAAIPFGAFPVFLVTSVLSAMVDSIFILVQRYNRPRLLRILEKQERKYL